MSFRYRWKNGKPPHRDQAVKESNLLDSEQFSHPQDQKIAEDAARKYVGVPTSIPDDEKPVLPQAAPPEEEF